MFPPNRPNQTRSQFRPGDRHVVPPHIAQRRVVRSSRGFGSSSGVMMEGGATWLEGRVEVRKMEGWSWGRDRFTKTISWSLGCDPSFQKRERSMCFHQNKTFSPIGVMFPNRFWGFGFFWCSIWRDETEQPCRIGFDSGQTTRVRSQICKSTWIALTTSWRSTAIKTLLLSW